MAGRTKPKTPRRYAHKANPFMVLSRNNTRLSANELQRTIGAMQQAAEAFRKARSTYGDWLQLCTALNVGQAIERGGVIRGFSPMLNRAYETLQSIGTRFDTSPTGDGTTWSPTALRHHELAAIDDLLYAYAFQVKEVTFGEYQRAYALAVARVRTDGGAVVKQPATQPREHITDGTPCWCHPELNFKDPATGTEVWVHKEPQ